MPQDHSSLSVADLPIAPSATGNLLAADGYVCVSWWQDPHYVVPPYKGSYTYEHYDTLNDAVDAYADFERGEHRNFSPVGIFPARNGMPFGNALDGLTIARMTRETG